MQSEDSETLLSARSCRIIVNRVYPSTAVSGICDAVAHYAGIHLEGIIYKLSPQ